MGNNNLACANRSHHGLWKFVGGTTLLLLAAGLLVAFPDIKRYIRISTM